MIEYQCLIEMLKKVKNNWLKIRNEYPNDLPLHPLLKNQ